MAEDIESCTEDEFPRRPDHRMWTLENGFRDSPHGGMDPPGILGRQRMAGELVDVVAGGKRLLPRTAQHDGAQVGAGRATLQSPGEFCQHGERERIARRWPVERQGDDRPGFFKNQLIAHGLDPALFSCFPPRLRSGVTSAPSCWH